jgi:hemerythrin
MDKIIKIKVAPGIDWVEFPGADLRILCGSPADAVKHLLAKGLIKTFESNGISYESGPNCILLYDTAVQNGQFCNLGEFPVLQMLYRQGMIIPNHPNNKGQKPSLIGNRTQLDAQLEYIYRGNYGLVSEEELISAGCTKEEAKEIFRMKLKFAFGKIISSDEFFNIIELADQEIEIKNGVKMKRLALNKFQFSYQGESVEIDLNLAAEENYKPPYSLGFRNIERNHFTVIHSGDGDGWDIHQPCMSSVIIYNSDVYLIDAGPNILTTLNSLGISISEVKGVFHTHCHDDHFNGLTTLIQADHKIIYYATPIVRASVSKKLSALMSVDDDILEKYFLIQDLTFDEWNQFGGLEVKPLLSPHPVETSNFYFRVIADGDYKTYYHMADTSSFEVLEKMVTDDENAPGISAEKLKEIKINYQLSANIKKIDIGGGLIHGQAEDFEHDESGKVILSHTSKDLTSTEKMIGSRASFGLEEILIKSNTNQIIRYAKKYLQSYFENVDHHDLEDLLNCPLQRFNAGSIILKKGHDNSYLYLTLTGNIEVIVKGATSTQFMSAGSFVGEMGALLNEPRKKTYIASSYVWALKIPANMYQDFVNKHQLKNELLNSRTNRGFLASVKVFKDVSSSGAIHRVAKNLRRLNIKKGQKIPELNNESLIILVKGSIELIKNNQVIEVLESGSVCGETNIIDSTKSKNYEINVTEDSEYAIIDAQFIRNIPSVMWTLFAIYQHRKGL